MKDKLEENIVFFDGVCNLCNFFVNLGLKLDSQRVLKFASLQGNTASKYLAQVDRTPPFETLVFYSNHQIYRRSDAVISIVLALGGAYQCARIFFLIPRPIRDLAYRALAKSRYLLFGREGILPGSTSR